MKTGGSRPWTDNDGLTESMKRGIPWWIGLVILAVILVLPNLVGTKLSKLWLATPGLDKPTHFLAFIIIYLVVYGVLLRWPWSGSGTGKVRVLAVGLAVGLSLADESAQAFLKMGRTAEYGDLIADGAGVLVGLVCVSAPQLGAKRAIAAVTLLLVPVGIVAVKTHRDLKHYHQGMVYEREHDYVRARSEYQLALDSGFQSAELYNAIAWLDIEFLEADPSKTLWYAAQAYSLEPESADIADTYGWVLVKAGEPDKGLPLLKKAKALRPDIYCIDLHLGVAYHEMGEEGQATEYLKHQIERNADDRWGKSARMVLEQMGRNAGSR